MKLKNKILKLLLAMLIITRFTAQDIAPMFTSIVQAKVENKIPSATVTDTTLYEGYKDYQIKFKNLSKDAAVTYSSSNKSIASVSKKGVIKPVKIGTAAITISITQSGKLYTSKIAVKVVKPYITITNSKEEMKVDSSFTFKGKAYGLDEASLTWSSSNTAVATIDKKTGEVKAIDWGTTFIILQDTTKKYSFKLKLTVIDPYTPPEGSDKAVYLSGLDLSKKTGTYYKTSKEEYIETTRFVLYLEEGIEIPVNVIELIDHCMNLIEEETGYMFYAKKYFGSNDFNMDQVIDGVFSTAKELKKVNAKHDRLNIVVVKEGYDSSTDWGTNGLLLLAEDIKLLDGNELNFIYEMLSLLLYRNGFSLGNVLMEGFRLYYTTLITEKDKVLSGKYDGYYELQDFNVKVTEDEMESYFLSALGYDADKLGFRMMHYIIETYGKEGLRKVHEKLLTGTSDKKLVATIKSELSEDFFKEFIRWLSQNRERFGDVDLSTIGDWYIKDEKLCKYYGDDAYVEVPDGVRSIEYEAFRGCDTLEIIVLPETVTTIGNRAFSYCENLKEVIIPDSVTIIGYGAFQECHSLEKLELPKGITFIGDMTFDSCYSLSEVSLPDSLERIGDFAFAYCGIKEVIIPNSVKSIGDYAFSSIYDIAIRGEKGSYAEIYAKENNIKFVTINIAKK